jgi:hypothetical protein
VKAVEPGPAPEPSKLLARCAECRPSGRQATHEVVAPRRPRRARERTSVPREARQPKSGSHVVRRWSPVPRVARPKFVRPPWAGTPVGLPRRLGGHPGREAQGDYRGGLTSRRSSSTCSGEGGPNGVNRGSRLTKKI